MSSARPDAGLAPRAGLAVPQRAELLWVEGEDAASFLNGLLTNDVGELAEGDSQRSLLLDSKGRVRTLVRVRRDAPSVYSLMVQPGDGDRMLDDLERYHFSEAIEILGPEPVDTLVVAGDDPGSPDVPAELDVVGWPPGTRELVVSDAAATLAGAGREPSPPAELDALRIHTLTPMPGRDFEESALVQELGLEHLAVSFAKGCYLGQETVARVEHRGKVNRRLRALLLEGPTPERAPVSLEGGEVGALGTVARTGSGEWMALAVLRSAADVGAEVSVDGAPARVMAPPPDPD